MSRLFVGCCLTSNNNHCACLFVFCCSSVPSLLLSVALTDACSLHPQDFYNMETKLASQESQLLECEAQLRTQMVTEKALRTENDGLVSEVQRVSRELEDKRIEVEELTDALGKVKEDFVEGKPLSDRTIHNVLLCVLWCGCLCWCSGMAVFVWALLSASSHWCGCLADQ